MRFPVTRYAGDGVVDAARERRNGGIDFLEAAMWPDAERVRISRKQALQAALVCGTFADPTLVGRLPLEVLQKLPMEGEAVVLVMIDHDEMAHGRNFVEVIAVGVAQIEREHLFVLAELVGALVDVGVHSLLRGTK